MPADEINLFQKIYNLLSHNIDLLSFILNLNNNPMKKLKLISIAFLMLLLSSCGNSGSKSETPVTSDNASGTPAVTPAVIKKYGIKSGIVTFESTGMGITQKSVLYFDDFGAREAEEKYNEDNSIKESSLCDGKNRYTIIYKDKAAFPAGECSRGIAYRFDWDEASRAGAEYKPQKLANLTIAGKDCESFSLLTSGHTSTYAGWNNICLLLDQDTEYGKITYKAISIEENATIPAGKLNVPSDFKVN